MALKKGLILIKLVSTAGTGYFLIRKKNPKKLQKKLSFMKYDPVVRKHVLFEEKKEDSQE
jgi:large subunit ribosomal protein L33